jgi:predicted esterase
MPELQANMRREIPVRSYKRRFDSTLLGRMAHADVFEIGANPRFLFVLMGGSGVDEVEYCSRSQTVIPVFGKILDDVARENVSLVMVHVTAPYDVPFNRFASEPNAAARWNDHVIKELLQPLAPLPYFVAGFSGGIALALFGLHGDARCFGAAAFGGDAVPRGFSRPAHWKETLRLYVAPQDRVCADAGNRHVVDSLVSRGEAEVHQLRTGGHRLMDYVTHDGLGDAIRFANKTTP